MTGRLSGKTVLVTSAAQGIGRATAIAMANEGAKVWATDIRGDLLEVLAKEQAGISTFTLNVLSVEDIAAAAAKTGAIDGLFNCSGFVHQGSILEAEDKDFDFSFSLNVKVEMPGCSLAKTSSKSPRMSVAQTLAPSFAIAMAVARPMPWAAEVTKTVLPESLPVIFCS